LTDKKMKKILASVLASFLPLSAFAVTGTYSGSTGVVGLMSWFSGILSLAVPIIIALAVVFLIWNIFRFAVAGNEEDKAKAKTHMIWGIVGLFIMVSIWGLVAVLSNTFSLSNTAQTGPSIPVINN
jgi:hypothetical protein